MEESPAVSPVQSAWIKIYVTASAGQRPPLLDVRCPRSRTTLPWSTTFDGCGPASEDSLLSRIHELPHRGALLNPVGIVCSNIKTATDSQSLLSKRGIDSVILSSGCIEQIEVAVRGPGLSRPLWQPAPALRCLLPQVENELAELAGVPRRTALDVGCGSGRDSSFLSAREWNVVCVDRDSSLVAKAQLLANRRDQGVCTEGASCERCAGCHGHGRMGTVVGMVRTFGGDLREDKKWLEAHASHLVVVIRFLRRGLLDLLWHAVLPGGFIVYEHFLSGCERFGGPMKQSQMLQRGELGELFAARGFKILLEEDHTLDDGRPITRFLARRVLPQS